MGRTIQERVKDPSYWIADQLPHWGVGLVISFAISFGLIFGAGWDAGWKLVLAILLAQFAMIGGFIYELVQNWGDDPIAGGQEDSTIDAGFIWLGVQAGTAIGALVGVLVA